MTSDANAPERADMPLEVKPLKWTDLVDGQFFASAHGYGYEAGCEDEIGPFHWYENLTGSYCDGFDDIDSAKAAAQADYERRMMAHVKLAPITPQSAAKTLLSDDILLSRMAKAMHDGPLGADEYWYSAATKTGAWCLDMVRAALRTIAADDTTPKARPIAEIEAAAFRRGAEQMRERAAWSAQHRYREWNDLSSVECDYTACLDVASAIRALPLTEEDKA